MELSFRASATAVRPISPQRWRRKPKCRLRISMNSTMSKGSRSVRSSKLLRVCQMRDRRGRGSGPHGAGRRGRLVWLATSLRGRHVRAPPVMPHLPAFLDQHSALYVVLDDRNAGLVEAGFDVALRMGSLTDSTLTARKVGQGCRLVLGTPSYPAKRGEPDRRPTSSAIGCHL
jgi:hypothetical protein